MFKDVTTAQLCYLKPGWTPVMPGHWFSTHPELVSPKVPVQCTGMEASGWLALTMYVAVLGGGPPWLMCSCPGGDAVCIHPLPSRADALVGAPGVTTAVTFHPGLVLFLLFLITGAIC